MIEDAMPQTVIIASHRRSGTHWVIDTLRNNCPAINENFVNLDLIAPSSHSPLPLSEFDKQLNTLDGIVLVKTHTPVTLDPFLVSEDLQHYAAALLQRSRIIYVHRDGRDVSDPRAKGERI